MPAFSRAALSCSALVILLCPLTGQAQDGLNVATYNRAGQLEFPADTATWVHLGSSLGGDYREGPFDPANPGTISVVTMEPGAYRYFLEHGEYADGSMFLLSFYPAESTSDPQLSGFVQGDLNAKEIHVIDSGRFGEGRGFFLYEAEAGPGYPSTKVPDGSACVQCHVPEGDYDGTFIQFYPAIRDLPRRLGKGQGARGMGQGARGKK